MWRRIMSRLLYCIVGLVAVGAVYQQWAQNNDARLHPMPGHLVDVGGRNLHIWCTGKGSPTVVLESGLTAPGVAWRSVQSEVSASTRVCSYDRAGIGWSDSSPDPTRATHVVSDLEHLLATAEIEGQLLLVGWSAGGVFNRAYAAQHPERIAGMVLVDSSHEAQQLRLPHFEDDNTLGLLSLCSAISWTGILRVLGTGEQIVQSMKTSERLQQEQLALFNRSSWCSGVADEMKVFPEDVADPAGPASLGNLPLIVITRGKPADLDELPPGSSPQTAAALNRTWQELQDELAALSTRSEHWYADNSGHGIPYEQPEIIIRAIRQLLESTTDTATAAPPAMRWQQTITPCEHGPCSFKSRLRAHLPA